MKARNNVSDTPRLARFALTNKCNLSCLHCLAANSFIDRSEIEPSTNMLISAFRKLADAGVERIHFLGGEPSVRSDFLTLLEEAHHLGLAVSYNTNAIRGDNPYLDAIFAFNLARVVISIDGFDSNTNDPIRGIGTYAKAIDFLRELLSRRRQMNRSLPEIAIQTVITSLWARHPHKIVEMAISLGVDTLIISDFVPVGRGRAVSSRLSIDYPLQFRVILALLECMQKYPNLRIETYIKPLVVQYMRMYVGLNILPKPFVCPAIRQSIDIAIDGTTLPCDMMSILGMGGGKPYPNIFRDSMRDILDSRQFSSFKTDFQPRDCRRVYRRHIPCYGCPFLGIACVPCPLPAKENRYKNQQMCLIAKGLTKMGDQSGGYAASPENLSNQTVNAILACSLKCT